VAESDNRSHEPNPDEIKIGTRACSALPDTTIRRAIDAGETDGFKALAGSRDEGISNDPYVLNEEQSRQIVLLEDQHQQ